MAPPRDRLVVPMGLPSADGRRYAAYLAGDKFPHLAGAGAGVVAAGGVLVDAYGAELAGGAGVVVSAAGGLQDSGGSFTPTKAVTFAGLSIGGSPVSATIGMASVDGTNIVSNDIAGPFGEDRVMKSTLPNNTPRFFGGQIGVFQRAITDGDDVFILLRHYFPDAWRFQYLNAPDGWGMTKWVRLQWGTTTDGSNRFTFQLGNFSQAGNLTGRIWGATREGQGDGSNMVLPDNAAAVINRNAWATICLQCRMSSNPAVGFIRAWQGTDYIGEVTGATKSDSFSSLYSIYLGDYYNGGSPAQSFYTANSMIHFGTPPDVDSGGRPYIAPTRNAII